MSLLQPFFDLIFPDRCVNCGAVGVYFCSDCQTKITEIDRQICPYCKREAIFGKTHPLCLPRYGLDGLASGFYHQGPIKKAIHLLKYRLITNLQESLSEKLMVSLKNQEVSFKGLTVVPVPLFPLRERKRGFNQAKVIAEPLASNLDLELNTKLLARVKNTATQVKLTEKERQENLKNAFEAVGIVPKKIVLVDDVFTTGATLFNAAAVLKKAGADEVWGLTLARAQRF